MSAAFIRSRESRNGGTVGNVSHLFFCAKSVDIRIWNDLSNNGLDTHVHRSFEISIDP